LNILFPSHPDPNRSTDTRSWLLSLAQFLLILTKPLLTLLPSVPFDVLHCTQPRELRKLCFVKMTTESRIDAEKLIPLHAIAAIESDLITLLSQRDFRLRSKPKFAVVANSNRDLERKPGPNRLIEIIMRRESKDRDLFMIF
jgi:hypothetical protein